MDKVSSEDSSSYGDDAYPNNAYIKTIKLAITFGGDTDTIASMAGALAGAYHGFSTIPSEFGAMFMDTLGAGEMLMRIFLFLSFFGCRMPLLYACMLALIVAGSEVLFSGIIFSSNGMGILQ